MKYVWKLGSHISVNAQTAGDICEKMADEGRLTAKNLLDDSRPDDAPLHDAFEWDDAKAAENYRENQARHIINCLVVSHEQTEPTRAFFNIRVNEMNYEHIDTIILNTEKSDDLLRMALRELSSFRKKYNALSELAGVIREIDKVSEVEKLDV